MIADGSLTSQNPVRGTEIQADASGMLDGQTNTAPAGAGNTEPEPDHPRLMQPEGRAELMLSTAGPTSHIDGRNHLIEMLDEVRRQSELVAINRARFVVLAQRYGLPPSEIAEYVGMSARAVKKLIRRATGTPGMEFGEGA